MTQPHNIEPPLVTRVEEPVETPVPRRPRPGFWEAVLMVRGSSRPRRSAPRSSACAMVLTFHAFRAQMSPASSWTINSPGLAKASAPKVPAEGRPADTRRRSASRSRTGCSRRRSASLVLILLVLPRRIGPDWKRQIGVRTPAGSARLPGAPDRARVHDRAGPHSGGLQPRDRPAAARDGAGAEGRLPARPASSSRSWPLELGRALSRNCGAAGFSGRGLCAALRACCPASS